ncbi:MAG: diguanylate cyclase [Microbacterium sp.]
MSGRSTDPWFRSAPCGLIAMTYDGLVTDANDRFLGWIAREADDVIGRPFASLLDPGSQLFFDTRVMQLVHLEGVADEVSLTLVTADGGRLPVLVNAAVDGGGGIVRIAAFNASARHRYEADLLQARRSAESSEARVRVLQDVSSTFSVSASDEDVAQSFAAIASEAFVAKHSAVLLPDAEGTLQVVGGVNPLEGRVAPILSLRNTPRVTVIDEESARDEYPELAAAMRDARLTSLSITPLVADDERLGILVCFFGRRTEFDDHYFELQKALGRQASQTLVRVRLQRRLAYLALHDQLTGAANRELLQLRLDEAIENAAMSDEPLSVLFLDLDEFKTINDRFGHATGDSVLVELARRLLAGVRMGDVIGRIGGDEFVAICANADVEAGLAVAERVLSLTQTPIPVANGVISASVSVGLSVYQPATDPRPTGEQLLIRADGAMYESKGAGKNRVTLDTTHSA